MKFSLINSTYFRPMPLLRLLQSVSQQTMYPDEILIINASTIGETEIILKENQFEILKYFLNVSKHRELTKQRNSLIVMVGSETEV